VGSANGKGSSPYGNTTGNANAACSGGGGGISTCIAFGYGIITPLGTFGISNGFTTGSNGGSGMTHEGG
jgi:hypothetical protein